LFADEALLQRMKSHETGSYGAALSEYIQDCADHPTNERNFLKFITIYISGVQKQS
jgi:hypothetical protein